MNWVQHTLAGVGSTVAGGVALHLLTGLEIEPAPAVIALIATGVGSLAPDIDHPKSKISRAIPAVLIFSSIASFGVYLFLFMDWISFFNLQQAGPFEIQLPLIDHPEIESGMRAFVGITLAMGVSLYYLSYLATQVLRHRGPTHSIVFNVGATILAVFISVVLFGTGGYGLVFGWGWYTHLGLDLMTPTGLPYLWWPFWCDNRRRL